MGEQLPKNWVDVTIPEFITKDDIFIDGDWIETKDQDPEGQVRLIQLADIGIRTFRNKSNRFMNIDNAKKLNCTFLNQGDILVARMPDPIGRACIFPLRGENVTVVDVAIIRPNDKFINNKLLMYFINSPKINNEISNLASGSTRQRISRKNLGTIKFPLPPLAEQNRIVTKLDVLFAQLETIKTSMANIPLLLKDFRQQVLTQAVTGKLTQEWRNEKEFENSDLVVKSIIQKRINDFELKCKKAKENKERKPLVPEYFNYSEKDLKRHSINSWFQSPVGFLCDCIVPGRDKPKNFTGTIPWITTPDLNSDYITSKNARLFLSEDEVTEVKAKVIPINSVVISIVGRFGISCVIKSECVINQQLHAYLPSELIIPEYLMFHIKTQENLMNDLSSSTTIAYINKTKANSIPINVPPIEEQQEIVRRVEGLFSRANTIEQQYRNLKAKIDNLPQALLHKAFEGELTQQLESDGDARELLEEIKTLKSEIKKKSK